MHALLNGMHDRKWHDSIQERHRSHDARDIQMRADSTTNALEARVVENGKYMNNAH